MSKPYLTVNDQIDHLVNHKGLIVNDEEYAKRKLSEITYFSLIGGYKSPFINPETRVYKDNSTFEDILSLYQFDKALRSITFDALSTVEEKLHQQISDAFCSRFGENQNAFLDSNNYSQNPKDAQTVNKLITRHLHNAVTDRDQHQSSKDETSECTIVGGKKSPYLWQYFDVFSTSIPPTSAYCKGV